MTCIVGIEADGKVYLGGDSIAISEYQAVAVTDSKVFTLGDMVFGFAGSIRAGQLIRYGLQLPVHPKGKSDMEYLVIDVVDAIRALFKDKGSLKKENDEEETSAQYLIGYRGHLYYLDEDFHVGHIKEHYYAIGVGADIALGSLFSTEKIVDHKERLTVALNAAVKWSAAVRPPFNFVALDVHGSKPKKKNVG
jgi:ATP-dependent protease HslVU (ClpYQ) peptidase subunit